MLENKELWPGWETVEKIGEGGFSVVYKIRKKDSYDFGEYYAALKVVSIPRSSEEYRSYVLEGYDDETITGIFTSQVNKIVEEFRLMAKFKGNSNVVSYEDHMIVPHQDGKGWDILIRMELLESLPEYCNKIKLSPSEVAKLGIAICRALELCQKEKIIHRDIKPQNIFVNPYGDYKLGDFGVARSIDHTTHATKIGTYTYMAPEVYRGDAYNSNVDIYSLGLVLYWLLNERRLPFLPLPPAAPTSSQLSESITKRMAGEATPAPKNGSEELKNIVLKACAFNPNDRYATASQMRRDLEKAYAVLVSLSDDSDEENAEAVIEHGIKGDDSPTERIKGEKQDDKTEKVIGKTSRKKDDNKTVRIKKEVDDEKTERIKKEILDDDKTQRVKEDTKNSTTKEDKKDNSNKLIAFIIATAAIIIIILLLMLKGCDGNGTDTSSSEDSSLDEYISEATSTVSNEESGNDSSGEETLDPTQPGVQVGDTITFGTYEQDNVKSNGAEAIEWEVLEVQDGKALIISKYALDAKPYNEERTDVTWETCTLRSWLNNDFYYTAFSTADKARIQSTTLTNDDNPYVGTEGGNNTTDKVFLLSIDEAIKYYAPDQVGTEWTDYYKSTNGAAKCEATAYAVANGAYVHSTHGTSWWWLRSPGEYQDRAATVGPDGNVYPHGSRVYDADVVVRPALWISLDS